MTALDIGNAPCRPVMPQPLYAQVRDMLLARVRTGEWAAGETLPNEHALSTGFSVSIGTVRRAVAELETNGVLVRKQGRGTYVAGCGANALQEKFSGLRAHDGVRLAPTYQLLSLRRRLPDAIEQGALAMATGGYVVEIAQRLVAVGNPIGIETSVVEAALFPRLETQVQFGQHLYPVLADYGFLITRVEDSIGVATAEADMAALLGAMPGAPLLGVSRRAITLDGRPIEWRVGRYLAAAVRYAGSNG